LPKTRSSSPRTPLRTNSGRSRRASLFALLLLFLLPLGACAEEERIWGIEAERFRRELHSDPQGLLAGIRAQELRPGELLELDSAAPYYLAIHFRLLDKPPQAEKLLRHAAVAGDVQLRPAARRELLELLLERGALRDAEQMAGRFLAEGEHRPRYILSLFEALFRRGKAVALEQALHTYAPALHDGIPEAHRGVWLFYRLFDAYRRGAAEWKELLAEGCAELPADALPSQWYQFAADAPAEGFAVDRAFPQLSGLNTAELSRGLAALTAAKGWYARGAYRRAAAEYRSYLQEALEREGLRQHFSRVLFDELVRAALYSGTTGSFLRLFEELRTRYPEQPAPEMRSDERARQLFWVLETKGYLNRRAGRFTRAREDYGAALALAPPEERERMRWYRYDALLRLRPAEALEELPRLIRHWQEPDYYDDVLFDLADGLVERRDWPGIARAAEVLMEAEASYAASRFAYLAARAAEAGLHSAAEARIDRWYHTAVEQGCGVGAGLYYRIMAAERLVRRGASPEELYDSGHGVAVPPFCSRARQTEQGGAATETSPDPPAPLAEEPSALLRGYLSYGLADYAYRRYGGEEAFLSQLDAAGIRQWATALQREGRVYQSIRMLAGYLGGRGGPVSMVEARLLYPRAYREHIGRITSEYRLPEHVLYALVREESYFDASISSSAGAVGLAQLMPSTARDIASRIGLSGYELTDPAVNLRLGGWYLDHLRGRTATMMRALFAYNGGLSRVRRWAERYGDLPEELLLEALPYAETKHYGRKVLVSSVIYGYLYHEYAPDEVVRELFGFSPSSGS
jgi:soluble lytic murein transglycosylase-like protein